MKYTVILVILLQLCLHAQILPLPPRPKQALSGSEFVDIIKNLPLNQREEVIFQHIREGNVPNFIRNLIPVTVTRQNITITYHVTPDYMCIGSDSDYFMVPMTPLLAQKVADYMDCSLPTPQIVDDIWNQAQVKMNPSPIAPGSDMTTVPVFARHNATVYSERLQFLPQFPLGALVSGNKKDVVVTKRLETTPKRVAIYGWHRINGKNIQPLYLGHIDIYADYSHGIRFIQNQVVADGQPRKIREIFADSKLAWAISSEGPIANPRYPVAIPQYNFPLQETFHSSGRDLCMWQDKFTAPQIAVFDEKTVGVICDPTGGMDTSSLKVTQANLYVQAEVYCLYRPELSQNGFERVGIFVRDDGDAAFEHTYGGGGSCYGMAWDSHNGRLWCFRSEEGRMIDLSNMPIYIQGSQWRTMRIETESSQIRFILDDKLILSVEDDKYPTGGCGIGYHEYFADNQYIKGTIVKNFVVATLGQKN